MKSWYGVRGVTIKGLTSMQLPIGEDEVALRAKWVKKLNDDQFRVLRRIADNCTNDVIAAELGLEKACVGRLISRIFQILRITELKVTSEERRKIAGKIYKNALGE
jgi:DNA-binding NarL/FixJ family response regulator